MYHETNKSEYYIENKEKRKVLKSEKINIYPTIYGEEDQADLWSEKVIPSSEIWSKKK